MVSTGLPLRAAALLLGRALRALRALRRVVGSHASPHVHDATSFTSRFTVCLASRFIVHHAALNEPMATKLRSNKKAALGRLFRFQTKQQ
jgi:hypothetical protein